MTRNTHTSTPITTPTTPARHLGRISAAAGAGLLLALAAPLAASAHVSIDPASAEPGSYTIVTVKVPNESATAGTSKVEIDLPTDTPFTSVRYIPVAGWTAQLVTTTLPEPVEISGTEITEAVTSVVWTADVGSEIADGQLRQFELSLGPVPDTGSVVLPAIQTYTDGEVVEWAGTEDGAEYPAPVLYINDAPAGDHDGGASHDEAADESADTASVSTTTPAASDDVLARILGVGGLVVGAVGIVLAVTTRRRRAN